MEKLKKISKEDYILRMSDNLTVLRAKAGVSQAEIARAIDIARQTYSAIERNSRAMSWSIFLSLFLYFKENDKTKALLKLLDIDNDGLKFLLGLNEQSNNNYAEGQIVAFGGSIVDDSSDENKIEIKKALDRIKINGE